MKIRFYIDKETNLPHIYNHNIKEYEVIEILNKPGEDRPGKEDSRVAIGKTENGRYLKVVYVLDKNDSSIFVITAFEIKGKILSAYKKRKRKKIK